ncbi:MAG TPA: hypothetical protein VK980_01115, partial [Sphingomonas sp.]|nr:hypothetical protein [Sphingomonas sp.]
MPRNEDLDRLVTLAETIADRERWQPFASYLALRGQGRRVEALRALDTFLDAAETWPFAERHSLLLWLAAEEAASLFANPLIPQPLWRRVVAPTAAEWLAREPDSARANYLYAIHVAGAEEGAEPLAYLRKAVRLDPADQAARTTFIRRVVACTQNAQHELPWYGYLGVAGEDIRDLRDALTMAAGIADPALRAEFTPA